MVCQGIQNLIMYKQSFSLFSGMIICSQIILFFKSSRYFFFHYRRITFSRLSLKMIYISQNNTFLKFILFSLALSMLCVCVCVCVCVAGGGGLWAVCKVESSAGVPCLPRFIRLASFSDTLLVVSILDTVYDCHLTLLLQS